LEWAYLVEVDIHALELEVGVAIVPEDCSAYVDEVLGILSYTPEPSRPCSPEMICL
jgi:hypothetical protein